MQVHPSGARIADRYEVAGRPLIGGMGCLLYTSHEATRLWTQMGHAAYAQRAQQLVAQLENQGG